jgi:hypothetical protein
MSLPVRHQASRYELKYIIDERCARGVRDFVRSHLKRDPHALPEMRCSYPIYSLYLDGPGLTLYTATQQAQKNRYKLRIRYYDHEANSPVFFEIKRRVGDVIIKDRTCVKRESVQHLLLHGVPRREDLANPEDAGDFATLCRFSELQHAIHANPRLIVYFEREAWISHEDDELRVTFDREAAAAHWEGGLRPTRWFDPKVQGVILELKFNNRFPLWMRELVCNWDLYRTRMGKYVFCMDNVPQPMRRMSTVPV